MGRVIAVTSAVLLLFACGARSEEGQVGRGLNALGGALGTANEAANEANQAVDSAAGTVEGAKRAVETGGTVAGTAREAATGGLVDALTQKLDVTEKQATGGAGAIFALGQQKMSAADFARVTGAVPNMDSLLSAAPKSAGSGLLGSAASALGGSGGTVGAIASLAGPFSSLGMNQNMVGQFIPIVLSYLQTQGGAEVSNLLATGIQFSPGGGS